MAVLMAVLAVLFLTGCKGNRYEEADAERVKEKGDAVMREWLDGHVPGAEITQSECAVFSYPGGGPSFLTGYVDGIYELDGAETRYKVNTETGEVYLDADPEILAQAAEPYVLSAMKLGGDTVLKEFSAELSLKNAFKGTKTADRLDAEQIGTFSVLPGEIALQANAGGTAGKAVLDSYIEDPENRDLLSVRIEADTGEDSDISGFDLDRIRKIRSDCGISFSQFALWKPMESANGSDRLTEYRRWEWGEIGEGAFVKAMVTLNADTEDRKEQDGIRRERYSYTTDDIAAEKTSFGYRVYFRGKDGGPFFYLYAEDGCPLLDYDAYLVREDGSKEATVRVQWTEAEEEGLRVLKRDGGPVHLFTKASDLFAE